MCSLSVTLSIFKTNRNTIHFVENNTIWQFMLITSFCYGFMYEDLDQFFTFILPFTWLRVKVTFYTKYVEYVEIPKIIIHKKTSKIIKIN